MPITVCKSGLDPGIWMLCWCVCLTLSACGWAAAPPTPPPSVDAATFREAYAQWEAALEKAKRLEAEAYTKNPELRAVEKQYAEELAELKEEDAINRADAVRYLDANPSAMERYKSLKGMYGQVYLLEVLSNPKKEAVLRATAMNTPELLERLTEDLRKHKPEVVKDWSDPNQVWQAYRDFYIAHKAERQAALKHARDQYNLPREVEVLARINAVGRFNSEVLYGLYLERYTPKELKEARQQIKDLAGTLTQLWPKWADGVQQATTQTKPSK